MANLHTAEAVQLQVYGSALVDIDLSNDESTSFNVSSHEDMVQVAMDALQESIKDTGLENDHETQLLIQLIAGSIHYSSKSIVARVKRVRDIINIGKELIREIKKDRKKISDMNDTLLSHFEKLSHLIKNYKNDLCSKLTALELAKGELMVIIDVLYPETRTMSTSFLPLKPISTQGRSDMLISVNTLQKIFQDISNETSVCISECATLKDQLSSFQERQVRPEGQLVGKRLKFWKRHIPHIVGGSTAGCVTGGIVGGGLIGLPIAGAVGTVVIAGTVFPPAAVVGVCLAGGAILIGGLTMAILQWMKTDYLKEQEKMFSWLNKLSMELDQLKVNTADLEISMKKSKQYSMNCQNSLTAINNALSSERHREVHAKLCQKGVDMCQELIDSIKELEAMDFDSEWRDERMSLLEETRMRAVQ